MPSKAIKDRIARLNASLANASLEESIVPAPSRNTGITLKFFRLFPSIPLELQRLIWKEAYLPRKIYFDGCGDGSDLQDWTTDLRLASRVSNQFFVENYTPCFGSRTRNTIRYPVWVDVEMDTVSLFHGLQYLTWLTQGFPEDMAKIKTIEASTTYQAGMSSFGKYLPCRMGLSCLSSKTTILVKPETGFKDYEQSNLQSLSNTYAASDLGIGYDRSK